jgi:tetratricopeptide (TPR) repeat protein
MNAILASVLIALLPADRAVADRLFDSADWEGARSAYELLLEGSEDAGVRAEILDRIGLTFLMQQRYWEAEARFGSSLEAKETAGAYLHRGQAYFYAGRESAREPGAMGAEVRALMNDAIADLRQSLALDEGSADAWVFIGLAERYRYETDAEEKAYRQALALEPGRADASLYLAYILEQSGKRDEAAEVLGRVAEDERSLEHWMAIGRVAAGRGEEEGAATAYLRAALLAPGDERSYYALWTGMREAKRFREFGDVMQRVLDRHPDAWLAHYYLGFCRMNAGEPREAIAAFEEVRTLRPDWQDPLYRISEIRRLDLKEEERAIEGYVEVLRNEPDHRDARIVMDHLAGVRYMAGDIEGAKALFRVLCEADPTEPRHLLNLALAEKESGQAESAAEMYREGADRFPFEPRFMNDLGLLLMSQGREERAFEAFRAALERDPEDLNALHNLGAYSRLRGDLEAAREFFGRAYSAVPPESADAAKFRRYLDMVARETESR